MPHNDSLTLNTISRDLVAGVVVFLVALPLCIGIAVSSGAEPFSGILAGVIGGIVVGLLSGSHTSVSGPSAGLTAIIATQLTVLQDFRVFLLAVVIAGVLQIFLGVIKAGFLSSFFPSSVIRGLLAAIGVILILKQIPHVLGHDTDPEGEMTFEQPDHQNTFTELFTVLQGDVHAGAMVIGLAAVVILLFWERIRWLRESRLPAPLVVVVMGIALNLLFARVGGPWLIESSHLVEVPVAESMRQLVGFFHFPDFSQWSNPAVYSAGLMIAVVASLETLVNVDAIDRIDKKQRLTPPSRELWAQGVGNVAAGLVGGLPVTSLIVRSSVGINAGAQTKLSAVFHGVLILISVAFFPVYLNLIPISCLAAILMVTGFKLANPELFSEMWKEGRYQFLPFFLTLLAIVFSDLVYGVLIGLGVSLAFILNSNLRQPINRSLEKRIGGEVLRIELANQVSFLNRGALEAALRGVKRGHHVLLDASHTDYIDPDVLSLIREFKEKSAPILGVQVSLKGFRDKYALRDEVQFVDYSTRELQEKLTSSQVLQLLREGNERFRTGKRLQRDLGRQIDASSKGQNPLAVVLSCIDSRSPAEIIFDLGLGDAFSARVAGNLISPKVLGSIEYSVAVAGAKLIVVLGHTQCGAVTAAVNLARSNQQAIDVTGCEHLGSIVADVQQSVDLEACRNMEQVSPEEFSKYVDSVTRANVIRTVKATLATSGTIRRLVQEGKVAVVGAMYDVASGRVDFMEP